MRRLLAQHPIATFIAATYSLTWLVWLVILGLYGRTPIEALFARIECVPLIYLGAGAPTLIAISLTAAIGGRARLVALLGRWGRFRASPLVWAAAFGIPIGLPLIALGLIASFGISAGRVALPSWYAIVPASTLVLFLAGPLCEELGWRGYLQPRLIRAVSAPVTALVIGTVWCFWHAPLSLTPGTTPPFNCLYDWAIYWWGTVTSSAVLVCLLATCRGSVPIAMAYHWASNASDQILRPLLPEAHANTWMLVAHVELGLRTFLAIALLTCLARHQSREVMLR